MNGIVLVLKEVRTGLAGKVVFICHGSGKSSVLRVLFNCDVWLYTSLFAKQEIIAVNEHNTIYNLSSGKGIAGIAVIRVSGPLARQAIDRMCKKPVDDRRATLRKIYYPGSDILIDEGLVLWFAGPDTFTGEDTVEFQIHGGRAIIDALLKALSAIEGFRPSEPGEFTRQAFLNGRLDLVEIEGLGDLLAAETESQRRQALLQQNGSASAVFEGWRGEMISALAYMEGSIDFVEEEDLDNLELGGVFDKLILIRNEIAKHLKDAKRGEIIRDGASVVLAGPPNAGKSSILNCLAKRDAAIVSKTPGTTRDVVEVHLDLEGLPVILSDTAGLHDRTEDPIEIEGMKRTRQAVLTGDIIIYVMSPDNPEVPEVPGMDKSKVLWIWNKCDISHPAGPARGIPALEVSAKTGKGMDALANEILKLVKSKVRDGEPSLISRERQRLALLACAENLDKAIAEKNGRLELAAEYARLASNDLARLVGRIDVEDLLDVIFRDFCVGK